jgi:FlaG/FlaF family flagellin (archaellin)
MPGPPATVTVRPRYPARRRPERATSAVVGVVLLVGLTAVLAAVGGALVGFGDALQRPPQASLDASLSATNGWPDGQRLTLTHVAGDALAVEELAVVVALPGADTRARVSALPTRRLDGAGVSGDPIFDRTYAGVDGELDAVHADGRWESGETAELRIAQRAVDLDPGDRAFVRVVHRPSDGVVARVAVVAS